MPEALLRTKLIIPPTRPNVVPRHHLIEQLNQSLILGHRLTLISAPAGFGKTTLVSTWIHQLDTAAWLSLDEGDNEPARFLAYLLAALEIGGCDLSESVLSMLRSTQLPPIKTVLTLLINDLTNFKGKLVLAFDDYHFIRELEIHKIMDFLLDNEPPQLHLVVLSRSDPAFPLHRLQASGQMSGFYIRDLRFTNAEARKFLNETMGLSLTQEESDSLARRTEGWVAGLQLAALSMQHMPDPGKFVAVFAGDDRYISDYLIGEVFDRQPAEIQNFLLKTAILERFCASLCDVILSAADQEQESGEHRQMPSSAGIIERLDRANLFIISLDNKREWYRYHQLFADFLSLRQRQWPVEDNAVLHSRAAGWFEENGYLAEAIDHALSGDDFQRAGRLIEQVAQTTIFGLAQWATLYKWMQVLPKDIIRANPRLSVQYIWALFTTGHWADAAILLEEIRRPFESDQRSPETDSLQGELAVIASLVAYSHGDVKRSAKEGHQALQLLPEDNFTLRCVAQLSIGEAAMIQEDAPAARRYLHEAVDMALAAGNKSIVLFALGDLARLELTEGYLERAAAIYKRARSLGTVQTNVYLGPTGIAFIQMGEVHRERNQLDDAKSILTEGLALCQGLIGLPNIVLEGQVNLARVCLARGDQQLAAEMLEKAQSLLADTLNRGGDIRPIIPAPLTGQLRCWLEEGKVDEAARWLRANGFSVEAAISPGDLAFHVVLARVLLEQGRLKKAGSQLARLVKIERERESPRLSIEIAIMQALWLQANGKEDQAIEILTRALQLAEPEGFIRLFVDFGASIAPLLEKVACQGPAPSTAAAILGLVASNQQSKVPESVEVAELVEPLTDQELRIVRLMAAGLTNREIGSELFLSVNTVKTYTSRIYGKLDVHNRAEAVDRAHELRIL